MQEREANEWSFEDCSSDAANQLLFHSGAQEKVDSHRFSELLSASRIDWRRGPD